MAQNIVIGHVTEYRSKYDLQDLVRIVRVSSGSEEVKVLFNSKTVRPACRIRREVGGGNWPDG